MSRIFFVIFSDTCFIVRKYLLTPKGFITQFAISSFLGHFELIECVDASSFYYFLPSKFFPCLMRADISICRLLSTTANSAKKHNVAIVNQILFSHLSLSNFNNFFNLLINIF